MRSSDVTVYPKFVIPFANGAGQPAFRKQIPVPSQQAVTLGAASLTDGFPPACFIPAGAGGVGPLGNDVNGLFFEITQWLQWFQARGPIFYDAGFAGTVGGYPVGTVLDAVGVIGGYWYNELEGNTSNPDGGGTGWAFFNVLNNSITTGHHVWRPTREILDGYVRANALTIGDAVSFATEKASVGCFALFGWIWVNFTDSQCPMFTAGPSPSPQLRGASSTSDWLAHCQITLPDMRGNWPAGVDTMGNSAAGRLSNAAFSVGNSSTTGSRGSFIQPASGASSAPFQTGTWYVKL